MTDARSKWLTRAVLTGTLTLILPILSVGCGSSGPAMGRVSGKVTYKGSPLTKGTVTFQSTAPNGRNATGEIQSDGSYTLQTEKPGDGALAGDYKVTIFAHDEELLDYIPTKPLPPKRLAPAKYEKTETSGLTATVKSGSNPLNFELTE